MQLAAALRPQDEVAIVAPSGPFDRGSFERGLALVASRYRPVYSDGLFASERYLAGSDERRLAELERALASPTTQAVFCARGGYGAMRLLSRLRLPESHKLLIGFSDVTALHCALQAHHRVSVHGPVVTQLGTLGQAVANELFDLLEQPDARPVLKGTPLVAGVVEGAVVGGNLSVLTRLIGTPFMPPLDRAILLFEDVGERPYRLDRMWQHLSLCGALGRIAGLAVGTFEGCQETEGSWTAEEIIAELAEEAGLPCVVGLPVGHGEVNRPFPLGARARLDGAAGTLSFLEGAVR
jgi:muramoyltetrapeptide carboxypeptidase